MTGAGDDATRTTTHPTSQRGLSEDRTSTNARRAVANSRYRTYGNVRADLDTGRWDKLPRPAVAIRADGAVLVDAGKPPRIPADLADVEPERMLVYGPLRWVR